jgi:uncharacterized protein
MNLRSSIYSGWVMHRRHVPRPHSFRYRVWWMLVDLDELADLNRSLRAFSHNRFNLFALRDSDYGHGTGSLRGYVESRLSEAGLQHAGARIELLTMPRICGYAFNPLSIYFCRDASGRIAAIIYEVHNTFRERHSYVMEAAEDDSGIVQQTIDKAFYVSPFMGMAMRYAFQVRPPAASLSVSITGSQAGEAVIHAALRGERVPLTTFTLLYLGVTHRLMTLKVIGAIHWEALRIWLKGIGIKPRDPRPDHAATVKSAPRPVRGVHG